MKKLNLVAMIDGTCNDYESGTNVPACTTRSCRDAPM